MSAGSSADKIWSVKANKLIVRALAAYVVAVMLIAIGAGSLLVTAEDASIGGGLLYLLLVVLGLPWSVAVVVADLGLIVSVVLVAGLALANAAVMAKVATRWCRKQ